MQDNVLTVSQVNNYLKGLIESDVILGNLLVKGEITNFKEYSLGGQWYFTLKDAEAQINCVVFQNFVQKIKFLPKDGDSVVVKGKLAIFNKRGTYNLQVFWLEPLGLGALAKAFEDLKNKLEKEGLFDIAHKKILPKYPRRIAILAAPDGAAVHDIITVAQRRNKFIQLFVLPTIVQGVEAAPNIVENINRVQNYDMDLIILARGGGSLEDLWAFNEENVAWAIYNSKIPIVSAVGHEIDYTIADFVADLRAPTPSAAAELVVPDFNQSFQELENIQAFLFNGLQHLITDQYQSLDYLQDRLSQNFKLLLERKRNNWQSLLSRLEILNPLAVLKRGFAVIEKEGVLIGTASKLKKNDIIKIIFAKGSAQAQIQEIKK